MTQTILHRGAEAILSLTEGTVTKHRVKKGYRVPELDRKIRRQRTKGEASILRKAKRFGVAVPRVLDVSDFSLDIEFVPGKRLKDSLETLHAQVYTLIGEAIARLHEAGIVHGDLTTSNMIFHQDLVFLIDFGLAKNSSREEDQANDLFLFYEALKAGHFPLLENVWHAVLNAYKRKYSNADQVLKQMEAIKTRRRYR